MKPRIAILAILIPLLAVVVSAVFLMNRQAAVTVDDATVAPETPAERRRPNPEPIARPPDVVYPDEPDISAGRNVTNADIEEIRMRMLASIAEDFRVAIEADIARSRSPVDANAAFWETLERYRSDPAWPTIPALPGVSGFEIQECPRSRCLSDLLAREPDDPAWARPMESRILAELPRYAESGLSQVFVVCRQQTCGVLLPALEAASSRLDLFSTASALADDLGFPNHSLAERGDYQAIYLTIREQSPEMWVQ